jgi:hypothetical protein
MQPVFTPARRERATLLIALGGPSGGGKTYTAMELAMGLAGTNGKIAFADTEARRALHYAGRFKFDHLDLGPPFRPDRFLEVVEAAEKGGYQVLVIDSLSHEYDGEGGLIDWADAEEKRGVKSPGNWAAPKASHKRLMQRLLQARLHLIFCLRADEKIKIERVYDPQKGREVTAVTPIGWQPIAEKRFMFEMTASFLLLPDKPGVPVPTKLQEQHRHMFPDGRPITAETGRMLARWANGEEMEDPSVKPIITIVDGAGVPVFTGNVAVEALAAYGQAKEVAVHKAKVARLNLAALQTIRDHGKLGPKTLAKLSAEIEAIEAIADDEDDDQAGFDLVGDAA